MTISKLLGRNLARIKLGKDYILIITFSITAISTMSIFLDLPIPIFLTLIFIVLFIGWIIGYLVEKFKILEAERTTLNLPNMKFQEIIWSNLMEKVFSTELLEIQKEAFKQAIKELGEEGFY